jgi:hypothetical protein
VEIIRPEPLIEQFEAGGYRATALPAGSPATYSDGWSHLLEARAVFPGEVRLQPIRRKPKPGRMQGLRGL